jgi:O-methyltransferase involved in polyketide biosynthesis
MGRRNNLFLIAEHLAKRRLVDVLNTNEIWDRKASTVIIAEGLLMYLPCDAVVDLFRQCAEIVGNDSRFASDVISNAAPLL